MNRKSIRIVLCFLLAALVVVQATPIAPHTCLGKFPLFAGDTAHTTLDTVRGREGGDLPFCVACALASQCAAAHVVSTPVAAHPAIERYVAGNTLPEPSAELANALRPRPPPPTV